MKRIIILLVLFYSHLVFGQKTDSVNFSSIPILNFGTFHMSYTSDENTTEFNEHDKENQSRVHEIANKLALFQPTVIVVETPPEYNEKLDSQYQNYIKNPRMEFSQPSEIELLAFEIGRLSGTQRIYGIDHKMGYNYRIARQIENTIDSMWVKKYYDNPLIYYGETQKLDNPITSLEANLKLHNLESTLDFLIAINADILTYAATEGNFEGADEAAKYYQRNLRMYSNLHRINLTKDDRVFILMGTSHTAFFRDFISRDPRYTMVNTFNYLK